MRNRSFLTLPSFYVHAEPSRLDERSAEAGPLEIFDITYLHFHSVLELGVCASGRGACVVEGENMPFAEGDVQIIFPFQRHLSRSEAANTAAGSGRASTPCSCSAAGARRSFQGLKSCSIPA